MRRPLGYKPQKARQRTLDEQKAAENFRTVVFHRAEGRSQLTGAVDYPMDPHHAIPKSLLKRIAPELVWEPDGGMLLTREEHDAHHGRSIVITFEQLPDYVVRFAEQHDLMVWLERYHPHREQEAA